LSADPSAANREFYETAGAVDHYERNVSLTDGERKILDRYAGTIRRADLLDVGVGPGRTVPHLRARAARYTGIDFSQPMIDRCRERFPDVPLFCCDVRDLSRFDDGSFDVVCVLFNGLCDLSAGDRLRALAEIRRVLRDGGLFLFSSHNRAGDAAVVIETMMGFDLPTYSIGPDAQVRQLADAGFAILEVSDIHGEAGPKSNLDPAASPWLHYVARSTPFTTVARNPSSS